MEQSKDTHFSRNKRVVLRKVMAFISSKISGWLLLEFRAMLDSKLLLLFALNKGYTNSSLVLD